MENIHTYVESKNAKFIECYRKNGRKFVKFICVNGHTVDKREDHLYESWCLQCRKNTIEMAQKLAETKSGSFLSEKYIDTHTKYIWQCQYGHIFEASYNNVLKGRWCKYCARWGIDTIKKLAEEKDGKCLSDIYIPNQKLLFECSEGHQWEALIGAISKGSWCSECQVFISERTCRKILEFIYNKPFPKKKPEWLVSLNGGRMELDGYCEELSTAFEYNGEQHYIHSKYYHTEEKFKEQQSRDREKVQICTERKINLIVVPYTIKYYDLYTYIKNKCKNIPANTPDNIDYQILNIKSRHEEKLNEISEFVKKKYNGILLSTKYINVNTPLKFKCECGLEFDKTYNNIRHSFCKCLSSRVKDMTNSIQSFCNLNSLYQLDKYSNIKTPMSWECIICKKTFIKTWEHLRDSRKNCDCPDIEFL